MFDLTARPLVWIAVAFPGLKQEDESGLAKPVEHVVEMQVDILDRVEFEKWLALNVEDSKNPDLDPAAELKLVGMVARNWRKVGNAGKSVPYNDENLALLLRAPGFVDNFGKAYMAAWQGKAETREKNSASSPESGRADAA